MKTLHTAPRKSFSIICDRRDDSELDAVVAYDLTDRDWAEAVARQHEQHTGRKYRVQSWL